MTEDFLHYTWKFKRFDQRQLQTTQNESIEIVHVGQHNHHAGPDFLTAKLKIDGTLWVGNVEIHTNASDWDAHKHQHDAAYDNVILHVVHRDDKEVRTSNGSTIPTLELQARIPTEGYSAYEGFLKSKQWVSCAEQLSEVDDFVKESCLHRMLVARLEEKSARIESYLKQNKNDWEGALYRQLARNFGFKTNADPFEMLVHSLPLKIIAKQKHNPRQIEALLFGQAGFLERDFEDDYPNLLKREYRFLQSKYKLTPINVAAWKFGRMRPNNFPTIRLAQFAALLNQTRSLFSQLLEAENVAELFDVFDVEAIDYWDNRFQFDNPTTRSSTKKIGQSAFDVLVINSVVPFVFFYGKQMGKQVLCDRAISFLEELNAEQNSVVKRWKSLGMPASNAVHSQGLLQLKNNYCSQKKCLNCHIGITLLKT